MAPFWNFTRLPTRIPDSDAAASIGTPALPCIQRAASYELRMRMPASIGSVRPAVTRRRSDRKSSSVYGSTLSKNPGNRDSTSGSRGSSARDGPYAMRSNPPLKYVLPPRSASDAFSSTTTRSAPSSRAELAAASAAFPAPTTITSKSRIAIPSLEASPSRTVRGGGSDLDQPLPSRAAARLTASSRSPWRAAAASRTAATSGASARSGAPASYGGCGSYSMPS